MADTKMKVGSRRVSGRTNLGNRLSLTDLLPLRNQQLRTMHIHSINTASVIQHNIISS